MSQLSHDYDLRTAEELIARRAKTEPRVVIIEGPNYGGKSLFGRLLRSVLPGVTCIEQHDSSTSMSSELLSSGLTMLLR